MCRCEEEYALSTKQKGTQVKNVESSLTIDPFNDSVINDDYL